jgi:hypothetical protein
LRGEELLPHVLPASLEISKAGGGVVMTLAVSPVPETVYVCVEEGEPTV